MSTYQRRLLGVALFISTITTLFLSIPLSNGVPLIDTLQVIGMMYTLVALFGISLKLMMD